MLSYLDTQLAKRLRGQQRTHLSDDRSVKTTDHDLVSFPQNTVRQYDIDSRTQTFDDLHLKNRTLKFRQIHQAVAHPLLREVDKEHDHVWYTLPSHGRRGHDGDVAREVLVLVVEHSVETLLGERNDDLLRHVLELALHGTLLLLE